MSNHLLPGRPHSDDTRRRAAILLAKGLGPKAFSGQCGVSRRRLHDWLADDVAFQTMVAQCRARLLSRAAGRLANVATQAADAIAELIRRDGVQDLVKLKAATAILDQAVRLAQHTDIEARVAELERLAKEGSPQS